MQRSGWKRDRGRDGRIKGGKQGGMEGGMEQYRERCRQAGIDPTNKINYSSCFSWKGRVGSRDPHVGGNLPTFKFKAPLTQPALCRREPTPGRPVWTHSPRSPSTGARPHAAPKGRMRPGSVLCPDGSGRRRWGRRDRIPAAAASVRVLSLLGEEGASWRFLALFSGSANGCGAWRGGGGWVVGWEGGGRAEGEAGRNANSSLLSAPQPQCPPGPAPVRSSEPGEVRGAPGTPSPLQPPLGASGLRGTGLGRRMRRSGSGGEKSCVLLSGT